MSEDRIERVVLDILRDHCGIKGRIGLEDALQSDLGLDSVGTLTLLVELENHYQLELDEQAEQPPQTVREVVRMVAASLARNEVLTTPAATSKHETEGAANESGGDTVEETP